MRKIIHEGVILTCIHQPEGVTGLCPDCSRNFAEDPLAYLEFGHHPAGCARWETERARLLEDFPGKLMTDDDLPF